MQKGYKRNNKGIAVVRFFCGLLTVAIIAFAVYFLLDVVDWSDSIKDPSATMRPYVEMTASPVAVDAPAPEIAESPDSMNMSDMNMSDISDFDLTDSFEEPEAIPAVEAATMAPTEKPTAKPTATPIATVEPTPVPTPIATATPVPTQIPASAASAYKTSGFTVPKAANDAKRAITKLYISKPDDSKMIQINGYAYLNEESYDAANTTIFLIVTHKASGKQVVYQTTRKEGISNTDHSDALCANAAMSEFESILDVSKQYGNGEFSLGVVLAYKNSNGKNVYSYQEFDESFIVTNHQARTPDEAAPAVEPEDTVDEDIPAAPIEDPAVFADEAPVLPEDDSNSVG